MKNLDITTPEQMLDWIRSRRSTRSYENTPVEKEKIEMVLEAGRYAPSGGNSQQTHFLVITDPRVLDELKKLVKEAFAAMEVQDGMYQSIVNSIKRSKSGTYDFIYDAPVLIVTAGKKDYPNNLADASTALENMMLEANALDLGSVWINQLHWLTENEAILDYLTKLGLKEDETICASLALGYPKSEDGLPQRKPLARHGNPVDWIEG